MLIPTHEGINFKPHFVEVTIEGWVIRAAMRFQATSDPRYYLCGILLASDGYVAATNGHVLFHCTVEQSCTQDTIVSIKGTFPKSVKSIKFQFDNEGGGIAIGSGKNGIIKINTFEIIDGKFPDLNKVIPSDEDRQASLENPPPMPLVNVRYLELFGKAFDTAKWPGIKFEPQLKDPHGHGFAGVVLGTIKEPGFENAKLILMPMRE